jgi:predicted permease
VNGLDPLKQWFRSLGKSRAVKQDIDEELRLHIELRTAENLAAGMSPQEAARAARKRFGNVLSIREECREVRGAGCTETILQDIRFGLRMLRKHPGFAAAAVLTLALGIGATTTIFTVIDGVLLNPLPYPGSDRIVHVWERNLPLGMESANTSPPNFMDWRKASQSFEALAYFGEFAGNLSQTFILTGDGAPERLRGRFVSSEFFQVFGIQPMVGRVFLPQEDQPGAARIVILSHDFWQRRFAGNPGIVGNTIVLDNFGRHAYQIVGVMPAGFDYPGSSVWIPAGHMHQNWGRRGTKAIHVVGRLKPGITIEQAQAELGAIQKRIAEANPQLNRMGTQVKVLSFHESMVQGVRASLWIFFGAVVLVLLISCANVANLLLARALGRCRELAIRVALGAGRWRIIRQLLIESLVLSLTGGVFGTLLAVWGTKLVVAFHAGSIPRAAEIAIDSRVLGFTLLVSIATGLLFGLAPAWFATNTDVNEALKEGGHQAAGGRSRNWLFNAFTVAQIALALMLLVGAGLLMQSFLRLQRVDPGFDTANVLTVDMDMASGASYKSDVERRAFTRQLLEIIRALPGVGSACAVSMIPDRGQGWTTPYWRTDRPAPAGDEISSVSVRPVTPGFLTAYGITLLKGREFTESDTATSGKVIMINRALAELVFPGEDPVGKHLNCDGVQEIIGVIANVKNSGLQGETRPEVYGSYHQWYWPSAFLTVRTKSDPQSLRGAITVAVQTLNRDQPLMYFRTMQNYLAETTNRPRFRSLLLGVFALTALILASVGIYGVMAYSVSQRTQEMGVRLALGAQRRDIFGLILKRGMRLTVVGVLIGLCGSFALTRVLASQLYGVTTRDPATYAGVSLFLCLVALLACWLPARRAARVDPMTALRYE